LQVAAVAVMEFILFHKVAAVVLVVCAQPLQQQVVVVH
jgi:hypothetical protein